MAQLPLTSIAATTTTASWPSPASTTTTTITLDPAKYTALLLQLYVTLPGLTARLNPANLTFATHPACKRTSFSLTDRTARLAKEDSIPRDLISPLHDVLDRKHSEGSLPSTAPDQGPPTTLSSWSASAQRERSDSHTQSLVGESQTSLAPTSGASTIRDIPSTEDLPSLVNRRIPRRNNLNAPSTPMLPVSLHAEEAPRRPHSDAAPQAEITKPTWTAHAADSAVG
ncbi:hypothetical protein HDU96_008516 [Phlyctochytrium bullatum]|nr:hypothetical protein HDU96_008516 [Phlyctochytrium bullatum]